MKKSQSRQSLSSNRRHFIGGSDARIIMGHDEKALLALWREKAVSKQVWTSRVS